MKSKRTYQKKSKYSYALKVLVTFWSVFIIGLIIATVFIWSLSKGIFGEMPDVEELENPDIYVASQIIADDGVVLGKYEKEKRIPLEYRDLSPYLVYALIAKEDERYREHSGIDRKALFRAVVYLGKRGGGSTISQQLAKLMFTEDYSRNKVKRGLQKLKEMIIAVKLERLYTKDEIMTMYLNKFDFVFGANGVESASRIYFSKNAKDLSVAEAATLICMLENPIINNPKMNPKKSQERRDVVIEQMVKKGYVKQEDFEKIQGTPVELKYKPARDIDEGFSAYFKSALRKDIQSILDEKEKEDGKKYNLFKDGLKIYVTIDSRMQRYAEEAMSKHMMYLQKEFDREHKNNKFAPFYKVDQNLFNRLMKEAIQRTGRYRLAKAAGKTEDEIMEEFKKPTELQVFTWKGERDTIMSPWDSIRYHKHIAQAGMMAMDPKTGSIRAWVGGVNWKHFQYDHVKQGRRQVGSTFKPFVYATAIRLLNYTPCTTISNEKLTIGKWTPRNANGRYGGEPTLRNAMAFSINVPAVRLIQETTPGEVIKMARDLGVESKMENNLTIALGSSDISIYEMLGAYSAFANHGNYIKPEMIWRIEDSNGVVLKEYKPEVREVLSDVNSYTMLDLMMGVVNTGTGRGVRRYGATGEVAGKTGTTNDNSDGWFMGITPNLACGVWVGWEDRYAHFKTTGMGQGARTALPIWGYFMEKVYKEPKLGVHTKDRFEKPEGYQDCKSYGGYEGLDELDFLEGGGASENVPSRGQTQSEQVNQAIKKEDNIKFE